MIRTIVNCCLRTRRNGAMKKTDRNNNNNNKKNVVMYLLLFITLYFSVYYKWCAVKRNELLQRDNGYLLFFIFFLFFLERADDKWATVYATNNITAVRANCTAHCDWPDRAAPAGVLTLYNTMHQYVIYYYTFTHYIKHYHYTVRPAETTNDTTTIIIA